MRSTVRLIVAIAALLAFFALARGWEQRFAGPEALPDGLRGAGAGLGLLLLGSYLFGLLAQRAHLPKLSGYLLFGIMVGPSMLGMVTKPQLEYLKLVNDLAIAVIALTAGGEIDLAAIRSRLGAIAAVAFSVAIAAGLGVFVVAASAPGVFGFEAGSWTQTAVAAGALLGTLSIANSPAVLVAMMTEMQAHGPMARTALAATVLKDLILVTVFAVVFSWAGPTLGAEAHGEGSIAARLIMEIGGSVLFGGIVGILMALYLHRVGANLPVFVVLSGFAITLIAEELGFEPLLTALIAGLMMRNVWPDEAEPLFEALEQLSLPVFCVFFAVAGAKLDLASLPEVWAAALALIAARGVFTLFGVWAGARVGRLDETRRRRLWTAFVPQAGVVLALASIVNESLAGQPLGDRFFTVVVMAMGVHEIVGPILLRWGLTGDAEPAGGEEESENRAEKPPEAGA